MIMEVKKIAVKVWQPIIKKLNEKIEHGCLRRDAYINKILDIELGMLDQEITQANSEEAREYIAASLDSLNRKIVTFSLRGDVVDRLDEICAQKRMVRDAIINRILLMLTAKPAVIDRLLIEALDADWRNLVWDKNVCNWNFFPDIFYPLEPDVDPFRVLREGIRLTNKTHDANFSFYGVVLTDRHLKDKNLFGLNCHIPNEEVPKHPDHLSDDDL